jgi:hypothetical protein
LRDIDPLAGYNFDFFTKKESWQHSYDYLKGKAMKHETMDQKQWCWWTHSNPKFNNSSKCRIICHQVGELSLYAIVGISDIIPISALLAANSMDPNTITSHTESTVTLEELLTSLSNGSTYAKLFMEKSLNYDKPLVLQFTREKTINLSILNFLEALHHTILVCPASLISRDLFPSPSDGIKDETMSCKSSINALSTALTNLTEIVSSVVSNIHSANLGISSIRASDHELRKRFGPMHEVVMRDRTALVEGHDWAQARNINDFNDLMHFVGNGIGADKQEINQAKDTIINLIMINFNGVFDDQKIVWSNVCNPITK